MYMTGMRKQKDQPMMPYFPRSPKPLEAFRENLLYEFTKTVRSNQKSKAIQQLYSQIIHYNPIYFSNVWLFHFYL
jgi:hypothetical protein